MKPLIQLAARGYEIKLTQDLKSMDSKTFVLQVTTPSRHQVTRLVKEHLLLDEIGMVRFIALHLGVLL